VESSPRPLRVNRATETAGEALARIADAAERLNGGPALPPYVQPGREVDGLGRAVPRNPFVGKAGTVLFLRLPGAAAQFEKRVPGEYVMGYAVACVCGEVAALDVGDIAECAGGCGRWFMRTENTMRVARWPREDEGE
jgi:hypothetical protein